MSQSFVNRPLCACASVKFKCASDFANPYEVKMPLSKVYVCMAIMYTETKQTKVHYKLHKKYKALLHIRMCNSLYSKKFYS